MHDNTNGVFHGGVTFTFADDFMGSVVARVSRSYTATVALNVEYLSPGPLISWIAGAAEINSIEGGLAFVRGSVFCKNKFS